MVQVLDSLKQPSTVSVMPNQCLNGDFPYDTAGWVNGAGGSLNAATSLGRIADGGAGAGVVGEIVLPATTFSGYGYTALAATAGIPVTVQAKVKSMSGSTAITVDVINQSTGVGPPGSTLTTSITGVYVTYTLTFTPITTGNHAIRFYNSTAAAATFRVGGVYFSTFPVPTDGQLLDLLVDSTWEIVWRLKYLATNSSAWKWAFLGGQALYGEASPPVSLPTVSAWTDFSDATPTIALPVQGDYLVEWGALLGHSGTNQGVWLGPAATGLAPTQQISAFVGQPSTNASMAASVGRKYRAAGISGTLKMQYFVGLAGGTAQNRWITATPVRLAG